MKDRGGLIMLAMTALESFGERTAWCAFKTCDHRRVRELVFGSRAHRVVDWNTGVRESYLDVDDGSGTAFVTPPIDGFVLATSRAWLSWWRSEQMSSRAAEWAERICCEIQFYASERVIGLYGWGRVDEEFAVREFLKRDDEIVSNAGTITKEERALAESFIRDWKGHGYPSAESHECFLANARLAVVSSIESGQQELAGGGGIRRTGPLADVTSDDIATIAALLAGIDPDQVAARWSIVPNTFGERDGSTISGECCVGQA
jgi:hypothetical protein